MLLLKDVLEPKEQIYKYMTSLSKNVYLNKLNNIVMNTAIHIKAQSK